MAVLCGLLVEIDVSAGVDAHLLDGAVLRTHVKDCGQVGSHLLAILVLVELSQGRAAGTLAALVLEAHACLELVFGSHVPVVVDAPVDADDGRQTEAFLVAVEVDVACHAGDVGHHGSQLRHGLCQLRDHRRHGLLHGHLGALRRHHLHIADIAIVVARGVNAAQAHGHVQVVGHFVRTVDLAAEVVLLAAHIGLHGITRVILTAVILTAGKGVHHLGQQRHLTLERAEAVAELTLAAATDDAEVEGQAPAVLHVGQVDRGYDGCLGRTFIFLCGGSVLFAIDDSVGKRALLGMHEPRLSRARLEGALVGEGEMPAGVEETHAGGVGVSGHNVDHSLLREVAPEGCVLVCVCEIAAGRCRGRSQRQGCQRKELSCLHLDYLLLDKMFAFLF